MSRFGTFIWGDGTQYGGVAGNSLAWSIEIDWDGDGNFSGANEADRMLGIKTFRGRQQFLNLGEGGFAPLQTGRIDITLDNYDGRYDAWNPASPLYPNILDGRDIRVRVANLATNVVEPVFMGTITDIQASNNQSSPTVVIRAEDGWRNLRRTAARVSLQENIRPDVAVGAILDAAQWPLRWGRSLDIASDNIRYYWASGNIQAATELERVAQSFLGYVFINAEGQARFITRSNTAGTTADFTQDVLLKDMLLAQPWENRRNITRIKVHPLSSAASQTLWQLVGSIPAITSGTPLTLWANYTYNGMQVPGLNVVTPVPTTDWTTNTASGGGGTDKTAETTLTFSNLGDTAKLVFTYNGGGTIYLTSCKVRGDAIYEVSATDVTYPSDTASIANPREFLLDLPWQQDVNAAIDFSNVMGPYLAGTHPFPVIKVEGRPELQFAADIFDLVTATIDKIGVDGISFRLSGISHESMGSPQRILSTYWLEPYISAGSSFWTWDIANFGVDTIFGW